MVENPDKLIEYISPDAGASDLPDNLARFIGVMSDSVTESTTLDDALDAIWQGTEGQIPRDRIGLAFIEDDGQMVVARYFKSSYNSVCIDQAYGAGLAGSSLQQIINSGNVRIIHDLGKYQKVHPHSESTKLLLEEGVMSSLTLPLKIKDRSVGFLFFSSRKAEAFNITHAQALLAATKLMSSIIEKAWLIQQLKHKTEGYLATLGFVSHEMKSPLASIMAKTQLYLGGYVGNNDPEATEIINRIDELAAYLVEMVKNYLDFARLENGEMHYAPARGVKLCREVIEFAIDTVLPRATSRNNNILFETPDDDIIIRADSDLLRIVMTNLIDNAVKYGRDHTDINVKARVEDGMAVVTVKNQGVGFTQEQHAKLFKRFSRLRQSGTEKTKGSGLGLYLSWWIAQRHGGNIEARSEPGEWAEFILSLPLNQDNE